MAKKLALNLNKWSDLQPELLELILKKLTSNCADLISFRSVCSSWKHALDSYAYSNSVLPPWLLLWRRRSTTGKEYPTSFCDIVQKKIYRIKNKDVLEILDHRSAQCAGSSHGWLLMFNKKTKLGHVVNPISGSIVQLPSTAPLIPLQLTDSFITKAVFSYRNGSFVVAIIFGAKRLALYKQGQDNYTWTDLTDLPHNADYYRNIVFVNGQLFALSYYDHMQKGWLQVWDLGETLDNYPKKIIESQSFLSDARRTRKGRKTWNGDGLLESMGELLFVECVEVDMTPSKSIQFYIYKLDLATKEWEDVEHLAGRALCLSGEEYMQGISISTNKFPEFEENSIYLSYYNVNAAHTLWGINVPKDFRADYRVRGLVYNSDSKTFKTFSKQPAEWRNNKTTHAAEWFSPNPWQ